MRLGDATDPAIEAASLALTGRREGPSSRFASIELRSAGAFPGVPPSSGRGAALGAFAEYSRSEQRRGFSSSADGSTLQRFALDRFSDAGLRSRLARLSQLAPLGYAVSIALGLAAVAILWTL